MALLSPRQVAEHLGVSLSYIRKLIQSRKLEVIRIGHRTVRVELAEVERYLAARRVQVFVSPLELRFMSPLERRRALTMNKTVR